MHRRIAVLLMWGLLAVLFFMPPSWAADETCTAGLGHCSRQIAVTTTNSRVQFRFTTSQVCVMHEASSANTVYVQFSSTAAQADADHSFPLTTTRQSICIDDGRRVNQVNLITGASTATIDVIALEE